MKKSPIVNCIWPNPMTDDPPVFLNRWNAWSMDDEGWPLTRDDETDIKVRDILLDRARDKLWVCTDTKPYGPVWAPVKKVGLDAEQCRVAWKGHSMAFWTGAGEIANLPSSYRDDPYDDEPINDTDNPPERHYPLSLWRGQ